MALISLLLISTNKLKSQFLIKFLNFHFLFEDSTIFIIFNYKYDTKRYH